MRDSVGFGNTKRKHNRGSFSSQVSRKGCLKEVETKNAQPCIEAFAVPGQGWPLPLEHWQAFSCSLTAASSSRASEHVAKGEDSFFLFSQATLVRKPYLDGR